MAAKRKAPKRKSPRTHQGMRKTEEITTGNRKMVEFAGKDVEILVVQYPRGCAALVWWNPATKHISTNHAGLRAMFQQGVKDWGGRLLFPRDGLAFLEAMHDHLFLNGYGVRWTKVLTGNRPTRSCD